MIVVVIIVLIFAFYLLVQGEQKALNRARYSGGRPGLFLAVGGADQAKITVGAETFKNIKDGTKKYDIRANKGWVKKLEKNELVTFLNKADKSESIKVKITENHELESVEKLSNVVKNKKDRDAIFPGEEIQEALDKYYKPEALAGLNPPYRVLKFQLV